MASPHIPHHIALPFQNSLKYFCSFIFLYKFRKLSCCSNGTLLITGSSSSITFSICFFLVHGKAIEFYMFILNTTLSLNSPIRSKGMLGESLRLFKKQVITLSENNVSFVFFSTSNFFFLFSWVIKNSSRLLMVTVF